jgi:hypothetical protein
MGDMPGHHLLLCVCVHVSHYKPPVGLCKGVGPMIGPRDSVLRILSGCPVSRAAVVRDQSPWIDSSQLPEFEVSLEWADLIHDFVAEEML